MFTRPWSSPVSGESVSGLGELDTRSWDAPGAVRAECETPADGMGSTLGSPDGKCPRHRHIPGYTFAPLT